MYESKKRVFPFPDENTIIAFVYHTNRIERIPMNKHIINETLAKKDANPFVVGQMKCVSLIQMLATDPDLLPESVKSVFDLDNKFPWIKRLHRNLMNSVAEYGIQMLDKSYIQPVDVGIYRQSDKVVHAHTSDMRNVFPIPMPSPINVRDHVLHWAQDLCKFNNEYRPIVESSRYDADTAKALVDKAYEANLRFCCIKPFEDGSNRIGRLVENLLRFHWGLPMKIITEDDSDKYLEDIREMQHEYSNFKIP